MQPKVVGESESVVSESEDQKMVDKVNQQMASDDDSFMAKVIGLGLIVLGVIFVVLSVVVVILSNRTAKIDENLEIPEIKVTKFTSDGYIQVEGSTTANSEVMFLVDGEEIDDTLESDGDGAFEGEIFTTDEEGEYELQAATVDGFPIRRRSKTTEPMAFVVDTSPPVAEAEFDYDPVSTDGKFILRGKVEPETIVKVSDGKNEYFTTSDENGNFEVEAIALNDSDTVFKVTLIDMAGNERELARKIEVSFPDYVAGGENTGEGDLNGPGASTGPDGSGNGAQDPELPEAAGELEAAMNIIFGNQLMFLIGLIALAVLFTNSGIVVMKASKDRK